MLAECRMLISLCTFLDQAKLFVFYCRPKYVIMFLMFFYKSVFAFLCSRPRQSGYIPSNYVRKEFDLEIYE